MKDYISAVLITLILGGMLLLASHQVAPLQFAGVSTHAGPAEIYPTVPGATNPDVTQNTIKQTICVNGWTATIRPPSSYTTALKKKQLANADAASLAQFEEDHLISLELGGAPADPNNLWPESYNSIVNGVVMGARQKDRVENELHREVCAGERTLADAQHIVVSDWYAFYMQMQKQVKYGSISSDLDPDDE